MRVSWALTLCVLLVAWFVGSARTAHADVLERFEQARADYEAQRYEEAASSFRALIRLQNSSDGHRLVVLESRKYLAASLFFLGDEAEGRASFRALLDMEPDYMLDPETFPEGIMKAFREEKDAYLVRRREEEKRRQDALRAEQARVEREKDRARAREVLMLEMASTETVVRENSRWVAAIPFGVGQFQNGDRRLGITLATIEGALFVASLTTFIVHLLLRAEDPSPSKRAEANQAERSLRIGNWVTSGLLLGTMVGGVIDAQLRFVPSVRRTRPRALPDDLLHGTAPSSSSGIQMPGDASAGASAWQLRFSGRF